MGDNELVDEVYGSDKRRLVYFKQVDDRLNAVEKKKPSDSLLWSSASRIFTTVFLPQGYPESVSDDYLEYQFWDSLQAFCSSMTTTLATHAVLKGAGVGDAAATPLAATLTWLLRDGTSMIGRIVFAYIQGSKLDSQCKKWRLFADLINDVAICIDLLSPYFVYLFTLLQCCSGLLKSLVGTAGGATRAALTQHQARSNNLADVSAKDGSQETLVNLTALVFSLLLVPLVVGNGNLVWFLFTVFTLFHVLANYRAVKAVSMESVNLTRFVVLVEHFLLKNKVLSVKEANRKENVWFFKRDLSFDIFLGASIQTHIKNASDLKFLKSFNQDYLLTFINKEKPIIYISLSKTSTERNMLESVFQSVLIQFCGKSLKSEDWRVQQIIDEFINITNDHQKLLKVTRKYTTDIFPEFCKIATGLGWNFNHILFSPDEWRYDFY